MTTQMQGNISTVNAPFMSKELNRAFGLNQLGMRNVGEQLFNRLLPGMNNVSARIRYYSFYCWLFQQYFKSGIEVTQKSYRSFLKKAEYLLALINYQNDGIPGRNYASARRWEKHDVYNLDDGSKGFWANPAGIFGAYYANSLGDLGITGTLEDDKRNTIWVYNCRNNRGHELASAFDGCVGEKGKVFIEMVMNGSVEESSLQDLLPEFDMLTFQNEAERLLLIDTLFGRDKDIEVDDEESYRRRDTLCKILQYASENNGKSPLSDLGFVKYVFEQFMNFIHKEGNIPADAWGWWAYAVNEEWQMAASIIFADLLDAYLRDEYHGDWVRIETVVDNISQQIANALSLNFSEPLFSAPEIISTAVPIPKKSVAEGLRRLLKLYTEQSKIVKNLIAFETQFPALWQDSFFLFCKKTDSYLDRPFGDYLRYLLTEEIILRHYREAFRKMKFTNIDTHKLAVENGCVRYLDSAPATHSQPRVSTAIGFLRDLGLIDKEQKNITPEGVSVLKQYCHD